MQLVANGSWGLLGPARLPGRDIENEVVTALGDPRRRVSRVLVRVPLGQDLAGVVLLLFEVGDDLAAGDRSGKRHLVIARLDALFRDGPHLKPSAPSGHTQSKAMSRVLAHGVGGP